MNAQIKVYAAVLVLAAAASATAAAQTPSVKKPITHEALWMMKRVGAPLVSPDGKWAVFSVVEPAYETEKAVSDLWLVPTDGHEAAHRITNTKAAEDGVAWLHERGSIAC